MGRDLLLLLLLLHHHLEAIVSIYFLPLIKIRFHDICQLVLVEIILARKQKLVRYSNEKRCSYIEALYNIKCQVRQAKPVTAPDYLNMGWESFVNSSPSIIAGEINKSKTVEMCGLVSGVDKQCFDDRRKAPWSKKGCQWLGQDGSRWLTFPHEIFLLK